MKEFGEKKEDIEYTERRGSYGVIIEGEKIGVVKSKGYDTYFLTGGSIDAGETEIESLRREAREEIGFEIEIIEKLDAAREYFYSAAEAKHVVKECHFYRVRLVGEADGKGKHELVRISPGEIDRMHHESYRWIIELELKKSGWTAGA